MKTILEVIELSANYLKERGVARAKREAEELIASILEMKRLDLYLYFERPLVEEELVKIRQALKRRAKKEPSQYISGKVHFCQTELFVNPSVLIPRPETEILVEKIASELENRILEGKILWDLCSGSGAIGIALKVRFPELTVAASDLSKEALATAKANAAHNNADVLFHQGDLFAPFEGRSCDFLVANPPYVSQLEFTQLADEVKSFEPTMALVAGTTGLEFYQRISIELARFLRPHGKAWLEIGKEQGEKVSALFKSQGWLKPIYEKDWAGIDRFFSLEKDFFLV